MVIKGEGYERLYIGKVVGEPKVTTFGEKQYTKTRFGVRFGEGDKDVVNVEAKFELGDKCKGLKKREPVIVSGKLDSWEDKEGNKRWFLNAELVTGNMSVIEKALDKADMPKQTSMENFTEIKNDEELPF